MRRLVNLRVMLIVALSEIVTIILLCLTHHIVGLKIFLLIAYLVALGVMGVVCYIKFGNRILATTLILCLAFSIVTTVVFEVRLNLYNRLDPSPDKTYTVSGCIDTVSESNGTVNSVTINSVKIDGKSYRGKIHIYFEEDNIPFDEMFIGYGFTAEGSLYPVKLLNDGKVNSVAYRKNLRYNLYASYSDCSVRSDHKGGVLTRIRASLYKRLRLACGDTYGSIAYCMLTGDKSELDETTVRIFSMSGIAHVLAVSGLHVGILCGLFTWLLRKFRINKVVVFSVVTVALVCYSIFVGLSASVVRSSIMCVIGMGVMLHGERKDSLSALAFAFSAILTVEPFLLCEVGFLMSFSAVFGCILFVRSFETALRKIHVPSFLASPLSVSAAAQLGITPVMIYFFSSIQPYSILFNLLIVPIISFTFLAVVMTLPIALIFNFNGILRICGMGFALADTFVGVIAHLPLAEITVPAFGAVFLLYPLYFVMSRFFMLPKFKRTVSLTAFGLCVCMVTLTTVCTLGISSDLRQSLIPVNGYGDVTTVFVDDKQVTVIGDLKDVAALANTLREHKIRKIDTIVLTRLTYRVGLALSEFVYDFNVGRILFLPEKADADGIAALGEFPRLYSFEEVAPSGITSIFTPSGQPCFTYTFSDTLGVLAVGYSARYSTLPAEVLDSVAIVRCFAYLNAYPDRVYLTNMPKKYFGKEPDYQFTFADYGEYVYKVFDGTVLNRG